TGGVGTRNPLRVGHRLPPFSEFGSPFYRECRCSLGIRHVTASVIGRSQRPGPTVYHEALARAPQPALPRAARAPAPIASAAVGAARGRGGAARGAHTGAASAR